jgi:hypothetical protein
MGRADLIGPGKHQLVPAWQPLGTGQGMGASGARAAATSRRTTSPATRPMRTQHTGLPRTPRAPASGGARPARGPQGKPSSKGKRR